jgi:tetratricopeptide (TPR) repeat protein
VFGLLAFGVYNVLMLYAFVHIGSAWAWGKSRDMPDMIVTRVGVLIPMGLWVNSFFTPASGCLIAASYFLLWRWASSREAASDDGLRRLSGEERAAAEARLRLDPDDGAARLTIALALEKEGRWAEALSQYENAHRLSDRMFSERALTEVRDRLEKAIAEKRPPPRRVGPRRLAMRKRDWACAALAAALAFWSVPRALGALATLGFARWLTSADETPA